MTICRKAVQVRQGGRYGLANRNLIGPAILEEPGWSGHDRVRSSSGGVSDCGCRISPDYSDAFGEYDLFENRFQHVRKLIDSTDLSKTGRAFGWRPVSLLSPDTSSGPD